MFNGLGMNLGNLSRLSNAKTRSISPENFTGEKGRGGMATEGTGKEMARALGRGWKISPSIVIGAGETATIADIAGSGAIQHIWMTPTGIWRHTILRIYWDGCDLPSVECPLGDFFACAYQDEYGPLSSLAVCVNPRSALNCYWEMPFRKGCRMTVENISEEEMVLYYQIDYTETEVPDDCAYFHAQFRRTNPVPYKEVYTILDGVTGKGQYVGTYMAFAPHDNGWWGEGEIKFYMDGDTDFPTICGTGTEDYFCGSYDFDVDGKYTEFCTPYAGLSKVVQSDGTYKAQQRFSMYRWHITDPIRFDTDLRVTIQDLGWHGGGRYLTRQDDIATVAYWYQTMPFAAFPPLPDKDRLEIL
jgi:hypothetical protein